MLNPYKISFSDGAKNRTVDKLKNIPPHDPRTRKPSKVLGCQLHYHTKAKKKKKKSETHTWY